MAYALRVIVVLLLASLGRMPAAHADLSPSLPGIQVLGVSGTQEVKIRVLKGAPKYVSPETLATAFGVTVADIRMRNPTSTLAVCVDGELVHRIHIPPVPPPHPALIWSARASNKPWMDCKKLRDQILYLVQGAEMFMPSIATSTGAVAMDTNQATDQATAWDTPVAPALEPSGHAPVQAGDTTVRQDVVSGFQKEAAMDNTQQVFMEVAPNVNEHITVLHNRVLKLGLGLFAAVVIAVWMFARAWGLADQKKSLDTQLKTAHEATQKAQDALRDIRNHALQLQSANTQLTSAAEVREDHIAQLEAELKRVKTENLHVRMALWTVQDMNDALRRALQDDLGAQLPEMIHHFVDDVSQVLPHVSRCQSHPQSSQETRRSIAASLDSIVSAVGRRKKFHNRLLQGINELAHTVGIGPYNLFSGKGYLAYLTHITHTLAERDTSPQTKREGFCLGDMTQSGAEDRQKTLMPPHDSGVPPPPNKMERSDSLVGTARLLERLDRFLLQQGEQPQKVYILEIEDPSEMTALTLLASVCNRLSLSYKDGNRRTRVVPFWDLVTPPQAPGSDLRH